jgi:mono/diheme cytochrome c family protein
MRRLPSVFWAVLILGAAYVFFTYGVAPLTDLVTGTPAPLPSSLVSMYTAMVAIGILLYLSVREQRWQSFIQPILGFLKERTPARQGVLIAVPLLVGARAFVGATAQPEPPADPPGIHFNLPNEYVALENPLPWTDENIREGGILFTKNCAMCHGDAQDGNGLFARALQPRPANFRDTGTIAQLDENYLYWRIQKGGPDLPKGSIEYRSSMPIWENVLTDEEIWKIIMFEYTNAGVMPAKRQ